MRRLLAPLLVLLISAPAAQASDLDKERRWSEQIVEALLDGEEERLHAGGAEFLALYTEAQETGPGAVVVLHGIGAHPDWPQVVYPLRTGLAERGWSTLSLQLPVLPNDASAEDYAPLFDKAGPRIEAGVAFLREKGFAQVAIVAHSLGAAMAAYYLSGEPANIAGLAAIGMSGDARDPRMDNLRSLARIKVRVLDLYGQNDSERVLESAGKRAKAAAANPGYSQVQVPGADHFFDGEEAVLLKIVANWLDEALGAASP